MPSRLTIAAPLLASLLAPAPSAAGTPTCKGLSGAQRKLATELLDRQHPYDCCDDTISKCLAAKPTCRLAWRLSETICHRVAAGQDRVRIERALSRRARSMMPGAKPAVIVLDGVPAVGTTDAQVVVVAYACPRCPFCSKLMPALQHAVAEGQLQGKARLYFKVFPTRSHAHSKESALAYLAAARLGRFWEYMGYAYANFDAYAPDKPASWASAVGLDAERFDQLVADPALRQALVANKKEGIVNKVEATPTLFINGRKFHGDVELAELIDVVEEEHERLSGLTHR